jgi:6-phosphofructokinase 1
MERKRIGILTSGGDCPGLNAVLHAASRAAENLDWELIGFQDGFEGLLPPADFVVLDRKATSGIMHLGGTMLGTVNRGHFVSRGGGRSGSFIPAEIIGKTRQTFQALNLHGLIVVGGDGSLNTALQLHNAGLPVVGVPKTIDNDLEATSMTFGFDSAVDCVAESLDRLHTTTTSHKRVMVLEVMGRHAGWIALHGGLAGGADIILIPEIPFEHAKIAQAILRRDRLGSKCTMVVVAEGARPKDGHASRLFTASGENRLGGIAEVVGREIGERTRKEVRTCVLGHLQRGGPPTMLDRILGTSFGVKAVELIAEGKFGSMVSYQNHGTLEVPLVRAVHKMRLVDPTCEMVRTARAVEIAFGD